VDCAAFNVRSRGCRQSMHVSPDKALPHFSLQDRPITMAKSVNLSRSSRFTLFIRPSKDPYERPVAHGRSIKKRRAEVQRASTEFICDCYIICDDLEQWQGLLLMYSSVRYL